MALLPTTVALPHVNVRPPPAVVAPPTTTTSVTAARAAATERARTRRPIADLDVAAKALERELKGLAVGAVVYTDGKAPCPAGPWADDCLVAKDHPGDPNHCLLSGGPWLKPMLELQTGCDTPGAQLVPFELGERAQGLLRELLEDQPGPHHTLDEKRTWFWTVMRLCSIVGLSTNLSPAWFGMAPTSTQYASPEALSEAEGYPWRNDINRAGFTFRWQYGATYALPPLGHTYADWIGAQEAREPRSERAVVHPQIAPPYWAALYSLGWNAGATAAGSLYEKLLTIDSLAFFGGGYGCNAGQAHIWGAGNGTEIVLGPGQKQRSDTPQGMGFAFPSAMVAKNDPQAFNDKDRARVQTERLAALSPDRQLALLFEATNGEASHFVHGWYWADINIVGRYWSGFPAPIGAFREQRWERCWAPTAALFIERAAAWARWCASLSLRAVVQNAVAAYIGDLEGKVVRLAEMGIPPTVTPSELRTLRDAVLAGAIEGGLSAAGGVATATASALNGLVGTVIGIVNALLGGVFTLWQSLNNPANSTAFALVPQPLVMRSPNRESVCHFSAEREGGIGGLYVDFTDTTRWGSAPLRELAEGRNAPDALRFGANDPTAWLALMAALEPKRVDWKPWALGGAAVVGLALLWRWRG